MESSGKVVYDLQGIFKKKGVLSYENGQVFHKSRILFRKKVEIKKDASNKDTPV